MAERWDVSIPVTADTRRKLWSTMTDTSPDGPDPGTCRLMWQAMTISDIAYITGQLPADAIGEELI